MSLKVIFFLCLFVHSGLFRAVSSNIEPSTPFDVDTVHNFIAWACNQHFIDSARLNHLYTLQDLEQLQQQRLTKLAQSQNLSRSDLQHLSAELLKIWQLVYIEQDDKADANEIVRVKNLVWWFHVFQAAFLVAVVCGFIWILHAALAILLLLLA